MTPVILESMSPEEKDFRNRIYHQITQRKWTDPFWLGEIIWCPHVMKWGIIGVVVGFMTKDRKKHMFKTVLSPSKTWSLKNTEIAFSHRAKQWVKTPNVTNSGTFTYKDQEVYYHIYDYIHVTSPDLVTPESMGEILWHMHQATGVGYGTYKETDWVVYGKTDYSCLPFKAPVVFSYLKNNWFDEAETIKDIAYKAERIIKYSLKETKTCILHRDISKGNFLWSNPITVIDPNPRLWHYVEDLAEYYLRNCMDKSGEWRENFRENEIFLSFLESYLRASWKKEIQKKELAAAICIRIIRKINIRLERVIDDDFVPAFVALYKKIATTYLA